MKRRKNDQIERIANEGVKWGGGILQTVMVMMMKWDTEVDEMRWDGQKSFCTPIPFSQTGLLAVKGRQGEAL